jgi:hypothetical protein
MDTVTDDPGQQPKRRLYLPPTSPEKLREDRLVTEAENTAAGYRYLTVEHPAEDKALVDELVAAAWRTERIRSTHRGDDELNLMIEPSTDGATADDVVDDLERLAHQLSPQDSTWHIRRSAR